MAKKKKKKGGSAKTRKAMFYNLNQEGKLWAKNKKGKRTKRAGPAKGKRGWQKQAYARSKKK